MTLGRRLAAEALGTLLLVGCVIGSGILADRLSTDDAVALYAAPVGNREALEDWWHALDVTDRRAVITTLITRFRIAPGKPGRNFDPTRARMTPVHSLAPTRAAAWARSEPVRKISVTSAGPGRVPPTDSIASGPSGWGRRGRGRPPSVLTASSSQHRSRSEQGRP